MDHEEPEKRYRKCGRTGAGLPDRADAAVVQVLDFDVSAASREERQVMERFLDYMTKNRGDGGK